MEYKEERWVFIMGIGMWEIEAIRFFLSGVIEFMDIY